MNYDDIIKELEEVLPQTAFLVAFEKKTGEPFAILAGPKCRVIDEGKGPVPLELFKVLQNEYKKTVMEISSSTVLRVHGSSGCYIPKAGGGWKCICCG